MLSQLLMAEKVEITADSMNAVDAKKEVHFTGNAKVKQLKDWIHADEIIVHLDENNKAKKYEAFGKVTFEFHNEKGHYLGDSEKIEYYPLKSLYVLTKNAHVKDILNKRTVKGDKITVDMTTGNSRVVSTRKKPVKFTFDTGTSK